MNRRARNDLLADRRHPRDATTAANADAAGQTRRETCARGGHKVDDLENTGATDLVFTTVEFLDSADAPLPIPDSVRLADCMAAAACTRMWLLPNRAPAPAS